MRSVEGLAAEDLAAEGLEALEQVVERQRRDNEGLRAALRYRAVIEQAKGIMMARTGVDPDTAFRQMVEHSQRHNLKLTYVAAHVVARTITSRTPPSTEDTDSMLLDQATSEDIGLRLAAAAVTSAPDLNELVQTIVQHVSQYGVTSAYLTLSEPDGALRLVAWHGVAAHEVSAWQRIPPGDHLPLTLAATTRQAVWLRDHEERKARFPRLENFPGHHEGAAALPLTLGSQLVGVLGLDWEAPADLDEASRQHLVEVADLCAVPVGQLLSHHDEQLPELDLEPGYARWFQGLLDSIPTPVAVLEPTYEQRQLVDLAVLHLNPSARRAAGLRVGATLLEARPDLARRGLLAEAHEVLLTGVPSELRSEAPISGPYLASRMDQASLARVGSTLIISWARPDDEVASD